MQGRVVISPNIIRTSERIDINGNVIDPRTKQVIVPKEVEITQPTTPPPQHITLPEPPQAPPVSPVVKDDGLSVLQQIAEAKKNLANLEELKRLKIEEKKKELELLEQ